MKLYPLPTRRMRDAHQQLVETTAIIFALESFRRSMNATAQATIKGLEALSKAAKKIADDANKKSS